MPSATYRSSVPIVFGLALLGFALSWMAQVSTEGALGAPNQGLGALGATAASVLVGLVIPIAVAVAFGGWAAIGGAELGTTMVVGFLAGVLAAASVLVANVVVLTIGGGMLVWVLTLGAVGTFAVTGLRRF